MSAVAADHVEAWIPSPGSDREWPELSMQAPHLVVTMRRYLLQLTTFLAPRSVDAADISPECVVDALEAVEIDLDDAHRLVALIREASLAESLSGLVLAQLKRRGAPVTLRASTS